MFRRFRRRRRTQSTASTSKGSQALLRTVSASSSSSSDSDETADAPKVPLTQSLTSQFESLFSTPDRQKRGIDSVVQKIERLRRHQEVKIFERQAPFVLSKADSVKYEKLCSTLLGYLRSNNILPSLRDYASSEVVRLVIGDPVVRMSMEKCRIAVRIFLEDAEGQEVVSYQRRALLSFSDSSSRTHNLWSGLLELRSQSLPFTHEVHEYMQLNCNALRHSLIDPTFSFLAARYLFHTMEHILPMSVGRSLYYVVGIWRCYMDAASSNPDAIEWSNFNGCIKLIHASRNPITLFVMPTDLWKLAWPIFQYAYLLPNIFATFFSPPILSYTTQSSDTKGDFNDKIVYDRVSNRNVDLLSSFCSEFLAKLGTPHFSARHLPANNSYHTVFASEEAIDCCHLIDDALETYRNGLAPWKAGEFWNLEVPSDEKDRALQLFLLARYVGIDRYCKWAAWNMEPEPVLLSPTLINNVRSLVGRTNESSVPLFDNVPYLRRFRLRDGRFIITLDGLPEPRNLLFDSTTIRDFAVETLLIAVDAVLWLHIDGNDSLFDATGHYPILAGFNQRGKALYVAAAKVHHTYYFTCVKDGARAMTYTDEMGDEHGTNEFFVLALRHDPSDVTPPYPRTSPGAMDPTGPMHWLKFWPEKDSYYRSVSDSAREDDVHLETLLNGYSGAVKFTYWG